MQGLIDFVQRLGPARLAAMGAVTLALIGFFAFVILRVSQPTMTTLYSGLTLKDSAAVVKELERAGVSYELRGEGESILVPKSEVLKLRMRMAEQGLPSGGGVGYEIFDKSDGLSATSFLQGINHLRALEGELSRSIRGLDRVENARVHLVVPERAVFRRDQEEPSASIVLRVRGGLEPGQIRAVRHLVATAVRGMKPERVSIVDEGGRLLADGASADSSALAVDERTGAHERKLADQVQRIVESVVGVGRARVQVSADLDFNRVSETQELYDPESRVVRSTQTREETQQSQSTERDQAVTANNQLPARQRGAEETGNRSSDRQNKTEEVVNYEISRTTRTQVTDGGRVRRLSVAVLVDGLYARANGETTYTPRNADELERIAVLVRSAIGFDKSRGDIVEVVNLRFADAPTLGEQPPAGWTDLFSFTKDDILVFGQLLVLAGLVLAVLFTVIRPLVRRIVGEEATLVPALAGPDAQSGEGKSDVERVADETATIALADRDSATARIIELSNINGEVQQQSIVRVGELIERNPTESLSIVRQWLAETN